MIVIFLILLYLQHFLCNTLISLLLLLYFLFDCMWEKYAFCTVNKHIITLQTFMIVCIHPLIVFKLFLSFNSLYFFILVCYPSLLKLIFHLNKLLWSASLSLLNFFLKLYYLRWLFAIKTLLIQKIAYQIARIRSRVCLIISPDRI